MRLIKTITIKNDCNICKEKNLDQFIDCSHEHSYTGCMDYCTHEDVYELKQGEWELVSQDHNYPIYEGLHIWTSTGYGIGQIKYWCDDIKSLEVICCDEIISTKDATLLPF